MREEPSSPHHGSPPSFSTRRKGALVAVWWLVFGLPILGLAAEVVLRIGRSETKRMAQKFEAGNPNLFLTTDIREAAGPSLWKTKWQRYRPGARLERILGSDHFVVEINSLGFRTKEFSPRKPPGTFRVLSIGGSTTVQGRTNDLTYPARLEARLGESRSGVPIEVLNLGVSGSYSDHWLINAQELFSYEPDLVIQYDAVNDIVLRILPRYASAHPWKKAFHKSLLLERLFPLDPSELDRDLREVVENQVRLGELCQEQRVAHLAASFASPEYRTASPEMQAHLDQNFSDWTSDRADLRLWHYADYAGILKHYNALFDHAVSLGRLKGVPLARRLSEPSLYVDICHMNQAGIEKLAEALFPEVSRAIDERATRRPQGAKDP